jgi:hypothetical protein
MPPCRSRLCRGAGWCWPRRHDPADRPVPPRGGSGGGTWVCRGRNGIGNNVVRSNILATVVFANAFLLPNAPADRPNPFAPRLRTAAELYNLALARVLAASDGVHVDLRAGECALPFGILSINFEPDAPRRARFDRIRFIPAAELYIERLQNRYRDTGIGAPLAADLIVIGDQRGFQIARKMKVPATTLLRLDTSPAGIASGRFNGQFLLFAGNEDRTVEIAGEQVPLENEPSAAFAFALSNPDIWQAELTGFFKGDLFENLATQLAAVEPYRPGRIPGRVQGTASSVGRWADLLNDLQNDPTIRDRFQFRLFTYNTGNPCRFPRCNSAPPSMPRPTGRIRTGASRRCRTWS